MAEHEKLKHYGEALGRQKKLIKAVQYLLFTLFIFLSAGTVAALPLRYFTGMDSTLPLIALMTVSGLSFIYGFLGVYSNDELFREMDKNLGFNEKMSAAWQFGGTHNPYSRLLMDEAREIMEKTEPGKVFTIKISRKDPFIPLLLALFLFFWLSGFSFLRIDDNQLAISDVMEETSERIDAVNSDNTDRDLNELSDEYMKLGQKLKDRFMNEKSLDREVEKLSKRLEKKIDSLMRDSPDKDSKIQGENEPESEVHQLERKEEMSDELRDILDSLLKTFSPSSELAYGSPSASDGKSMEKSGSGPPSESGDKGIGSDSEDDNSSGTADSEEPEQSPDTTDSGQDPGESYGSSTKPGGSDMSSDKNNSESESGANQEKDSPKETEEKGDGKGMTASPEETDSSRLTERKESGEFNNEDNIRGQQQEGEQMKSFVRALPHMVKPTREQMDIIHFYRNQLESTVDNEILPEGYEPVIRDYFLGIGVLKDE